MALPGLSYRSWTCALKNILPHVLPSPPFSPLKSRFWCLMSDIENWFHGLFQLNQTIQQTKISQNQCNCFLNKSTFISNKKCRQYGMIMGKPTEMTTPQIIEIYKSKSKKGLNIFAYISLFLLFFWYLLPHFLLFKKFTSESLGGAALFAHPP